MFKYARPVCSAFLRKEYLTGLLLARNKFIRVHRSVDTKHLSTSSMFQNISWNDEIHRIACNNKSQSTILKRLLLEFENEQNAYVTNKSLIFEQLKRFYMPKHLNLNFLNILVDLASPNRHPYEIDALRSLHLCVILVNESNLNANGQIIFSGKEDKEDDCDLQTLNSMSLLNKHAKLIAVVQDSSEPTPKEFKVLDRKPDIIISSSYVLKLNRFTDQFKLVEFHGNSSILDESEVEFSLKRIQLKPSIDKANIKQMLQQCI